MSSFYVKQYQQFFFMFKNIIDNNRFHTMDKLSDIYSATKAKSPRAPCFCWGPQFSPITWSRLWSKHHHRLFADKASPNRRPCDRVLPKSRVLVYIKCQVKSTKIVMRNTQSIGNKSTLVRLNNTELVRQIWLVDSSYSHCPCLSLCLCACRMCVCVTFCANLCCLYSFEYFQPMTFVPFFYSLTLTIVKVKYLHFISFANLS